MTLCNLAGRSLRALGFGAALAGVVGLTAMPQPAHALGTGAAVGLGLGAFALGTAVGAGAAAPYYGYPGYYYPPAPAYYPPPMPAHSCWSPYSGRYYPC